MYAQGLYMALCFPTTTTTPAPDLLHLLTNLFSPMAQKERFAALAKFKSSIYRILIATDVASR